MGMAVPPEALILGRCSVWGNKVKNTEPAAYLYKRPVVKPGARFYPHGDSAIVLVRCGLNPRTEMHRSVGVFV